jgi:multidrug efflux pump subunit AcrB
MALKTGEANVPFARAVIGGLAASTVLALFVVPALYTLLHKEGDALVRSDS